MSGPLGSQQWMYASGGFYDTLIDGSLRFNDDDSAYLTRTPASSGTTGTWTLSVWVKRANLTNGVIFSSGAVNQRGHIWLSDNQLHVQPFNSTGANAYLVSDMLFRDVGAWYHIVVKANAITYSNLSTNMDIYVNGVEITHTKSQTGTPSGGDRINDGQVKIIGQFAPSSGTFFDGYLAEMNFIDGTALDASNFGETKSGIWIPKAYSGSYGTNGFHLEFAGNANDTSGNGNNFTANNISAYDYVPDSPTNNFATFSPLAQHRNGTSFLGKGTLSEGNLLTTNNSDNEGSVIPFAPASGKWYVEFCSKNLAQRQTITAFGNDGFNFASTYVATRSDGGENATGDQSWTTGDIIGVAYDFDNGKVWFAKNNTWYNSSNPATNTGGDAMSALYGFSVHQVSGSTGSATTVFNAGQDSSFAGTKTAQGNTDANGIGDFYYTPPSGFLAASSIGLPAPAIDPAADDTPADYFNTVLYTGNSGTNSITGVGFQPDFVWVKSRNNTYNHELYDVIRGQQRLYTDLTNAEDTGSLTSFDSDGFTHTSGTIGGNASGTTYAGWNWKAGGTAVSNTDGSITSSVSASPTSGFSIVTYTGNSTAGATVGHGLGKKPTMIIIKNRDDGAQDWPVQHGSIGATGQMVLSSTAANNANIVYWNNTEPTSSVFSLGTANNTNKSGNSHVAYVFTDIDGFSKAGSYVGNGSSDGPFIYTGFRPAWVMYKTINGTNNHWVIRDNKRDPDNEVLLSLYANLTNADDTGGDNIAIDMLSNGFKARRTNSQVNESGTTYIYLAFAEQPFKYANAR